LIHVKVAVRHRVHKYTISNERRSFIQERVHLSGLRAANDFAAHNLARLWGEPERIQMGAVRVFND
jgi:hypothetical protein